MLTRDGRTLAVIKLYGGSLQRNCVDSMLRPHSTAHLPIHTEYPPVAIRWSPDSSRLALLSSQGTSSDVSIWDTENGRLVLTLNRVGLAGGNALTGRFTPDNHRLLHIAADNRIEYGAGDNHSSPSDPHLGRHPAAGRLKGWPRLHFWQRVVAKIKTVTEQ